MKEATGTLRKITLVLPAIQLSICVVESPHMNVPSILYFTLFIFSYICLYLQI